MCIVKTYRSVCTIRDVSHADIHHNMALQVCRWGTYNRRWHPKRYEVLSSTFILSFSTGKHYQIWTQVVPFGAHKGYTLYLFKAHLNVNV